ncbi:hypothetical protein H072_11525 [Dactylellina haptotyla CBS 200.50]|uniref:GPR1/FUN34/YaaH-class plasma membrane protein n=1 Tax=Dactylellina haptotyla (strain CBS 200.50) TaxID=1284197 RepID=S8BIZ9_DACHA|nr:hypothetical protein H072_11525 [Dactylellina haptotyla CBS 200.50]
MQSEKEQIEQPYSSPIDINTMSQARTQGSYSPPSSSQHNETSKEQLERIRTAGTMPISAELFEKLYLTPENRVHGDLRKTFGNPTPIAVLGFVICLTPLSMDLMGWRGAGGVGAAQVASYYFLGGMCNLIGGLLEFFLGNTFPFVVFTAFSGFWFTLGGTLTPQFNAMGAYSASGNNGVEGGATMAFNASFGFYILGWAFITFIFLICSLRTNLVFVVLFVTLDATFGLLTATYFSLADGQASTANRLLITAGAFALVSSASGWYILLAQLLAALDFPVQLPVGDLSGFIVSATERRKRNARVGENV